MKTYRKHFESFRYDVYWEILNRLRDEKVFILETEIFYRMYYSVLTYRVWSHFWCCCRSQYDPNICQFCTKLGIKDRKVNIYIKNKLEIDVKKLFPAEIYYTTTYNEDVSLFVHVQFRPNWQRPYSKNNFGTLYCEVVSSPFLLLKHYLDLMGTIILNQCHKFLLPALFENENECQCKNCTFIVHLRIFSPRKKNLLSKLLSFLL